MNEVCLILQPSIKDSASSIMSLEITERVMVVYHHTGENNGSSPPISRVFDKTGCVWGDIVEGWFETHSPPSSAGKYVLVVKDQMILGWHLRLSARMSFEDLVLDVVAKPLGVGEATHLPIGIPYRLHLMQLPWPAWKPADRCPLNGMLLGSDLPSTLTLIEPNQNDDQYRMYNDPYHLVGLRFLDESGITWVNKYALLNKLESNNEVEAESNEAQVFLTRISVALTARGLIPSLLSKSFPIAFRSQFELPLPILVFDRFLVRVDLSYSGAFE